MRMAVGCYWRFKGGKAYRYGWPSRVPGSNGLIRMGCWNGDTISGIIVDPEEIEVREGN